MTATCICLPMYNTSDMFHSGDTTADNVIAGSDPLCCYHYVLTQGMRLPSTLDPLKIPSIVPTLFHRGPASRVSTSSCWSRTAQLAKHRY
jgi:hypothetical protein